MRKISLIKCPICKSPANFWVRSPDFHYFNDGVFDVYKCTNCGHMFQFPFPDEKRLSSYYPDNYYAYVNPETVCKGKGFQLLKHFLKRNLGYDHLEVSGNTLFSQLIFWVIGKKIFKYPYFKTNGRLLDYGCGSGQFVAIAKYLGWDAQGIDFSEQAVKVGIKSGLRIQQGSIKTLAEFPDTFDCITCFQTINHINNAYKLFNGFYKALKAGGVLIVDDGSAESESMKRNKQFCYYLTMPVHVNIFSKKSLLILADKCGFVPEIITSYNYRLSQVKSAALKWKFKTGLPLKNGFSDLGSFEVFIGKLFSWPLYIRSLKAQRGDCILAIFRK